MCRLLIGEICQELATATHGSLASRRRAYGEVKVRDAFGDDRTHSDHCPSTDDKVASDDAASTDCGPFSHKCFLRFLIRFARPKGFQIWRRSARKSVIGKDHTSRNHYTIFDCNSCTNIGRAVYFTSVADADSVSDCRLATDNAFFTDRGVVSNVNVIPNRRAVADGDVTFDHCRRMNSSGHTKSLSTLIPCLVTGRSAQQPNRPFSRIRRLFQLHRLKPSHLRM